MRTGTVPRIKIAGLLVGGVLLFLLAGCQSKNAAAATAPASAAARPSPSLAGTYHYFIQGVEKKNAASQPLFL
ncbi:MAG: hypothetical protein ACRD2E_00990 [Terriglobales bacterium]